MSMDFLPPIFLPLIFYLRFLHYKQSGKNKIVRLTHLHVSNEWSDLTDGEVFPLKMSVQTYRYVQKLVAENNIKNKHRKIELRNFF